jgi:hypothetical protein
VHAALSYYFDHIEEMRAREAEDVALEVELQEEARTTLTTGKGS